MSGDLLCGASVRGWGGRPSGVCVRKPHVAGDHRTAEGVAARKEANRQYREQNADSILAKNAAYREQNRKLLREKSLEYHAVNAEREHEYQRQYRQDKPWVHRELTRQWRARKRVVPNERIDEQLLFVRQEGLCGICAEPLGFDGWHLDHIIPLSRRGWHVYANVQLTHPRCNQVKNAKCNWESGQIEAVLLATIGSHPRIRSAA